MRSRSAVMAARLFMYSLSDTVMWLSVSPKTSSSSLVCTDTVWSRFPEPIIFALSVKARIGSVMRRESTLVASRTITTITIIAIRKNASVIAIMWLTAAVASPVCVII